MTLPPDLEDLLRGAGFTDPEAARRRLGGLFRDAAEMLALARLSPMLRDVLGGCPDPDAAWLHLARFVEVRGSRLQLYGSFLDHPALLDRFVHVTSASRYLADILVRNPDYLSLLSDAGALARPRPAAELRDELRRVRGSSPGEEAKLDAMRRIHRREVLRIGAAELLGFQGLPEAARQVSDLADAFVGQCLAVAAGRKDAAGLIVLALGKWGGEELNYSSDVDLIFLARRAADVPRATHLARSLVRALSEPTVEGVVYRVDLRLRPYGKEGALVLTTRMFEDYLRTRARPAERQAMLKARAVAGETAAGRRFLRRIVPVILADSARARPEVRRLKARIEKQLEERGQADGHLKLAPGGIRDVEFLVQALQLEAGPARREVLGGNTLAALRSLERAGRVAPDDADALREAYVFLRAVEHRMQLMGNQQVHRLPRAGEDLRRLGRAMGFPGPDADYRLLDAYDARARRVRAIFDRVLGPPREEPGPRDPAREEALRRRLGPSVERLDAAVLRRCGDLLDRVRRPEDLEVDAVRNEGRRWTVAVAAAGHGGLLPLIAGLFTARRVHVAAGDFLKVRLDGGRKRILAVFEVLVPEGAREDFWGPFRDELAGLASLAAAGKVEAARERIIDQVGATLRTVRGADDPLLPVRIEVLNDPAARETELRIQSPDTLGFLFEFATTLAALNLEAERAVIRTLEDEVYDTFWVTDLQGRKIVEAGPLEKLRVAAALVKQFMHLLPRSPNPAQALRQFTALLHQMFARPEWVPELRSLESASVLSTIAKLMGVSRFLWQDFLLLQHENLFPVVLNVPALDRAKSRGRLERELAAALARARDPDDATERLNDFKDREMFRLDLRHITRRSGFAEYVASLSDLADVTIARAVGLCGRRLGERLGVPRGADGRPCPWVLGALGKFGGRELGLASDLDAVFVYAEEGTTDGPEPVPNSTWFAEFVKALLGTVRARREGSFEIDLRLRPHGSSGAQASPLAAFEDYYSDAGPARQWERMSLVKLRPAAGDAALGARLLRARDRWVYSDRPLDYENILHLRRRQAAELAPPGETHAKYSPGGLVDVEYFVQARQIEAGRRDPSVRVPNTLEAIDRLARGGHLRGELGAELARTYEFLRDLIDALRVVRGTARDSIVPLRDEREFAYLVRRLDYASAARLEGEIRQRMSFARNLWGELKFRA